MGPADFVVQAVFGDELEVVEIAAKTVARPSPRKGQALAFRRIVDVVAVIEDVRTGHAVRAAKVVVQIISIFRR